MADAPAPAEGTGNAFKKAFSAKIHGIPVLALGVPLVVVGALVYSSKSKRGSSSDGDAVDSTSQPVFLANGQQYTAGTRTIVGGEGDEEAMSNPVPPTPVPPTQVSSPPLVTPPVMPPSQGGLKTTPVSGKPVTVTPRVQPKLPKPVTHVVKRGETLSGIASQYSTSVGALAKLNGIRNVNLIRTGETLRIR